MAAVDSGWAVGVSGALIGDFAVLGCSSGAAAMTDIARDLARVRLATGSSSHDGGERCCWAGSARTGVGSSEADRRGRLLPLLLPNQAG